MFTPYINTKSGVALKKKKKTRQWYLQVHLQVGERVQGWDEGFMNFI